MSTQTSSVATAITPAAQRVALRCEIGTFDLSETAAYIASRITEAGGTAAGMFSREAVALIHEYSGGIPRTISVLCDNALVSGMALGRKPVDHSIIVEVGRDFCVSSADPGAEPVMTTAEKPAAGSASEAAVDALPKRQRSLWFRRARNLFSQPAEVLSK